MMRSITNALVGVVAAFVLVLVLGGCAKAWQVSQIIADKLSCAIANQNLPNEEIVRRCAIQPGDVERVLAIVGTAREESAKEALAAMARQSEQDHRTGACK